MMMIVRPRVVASQPTPRKPRPRPNPRDSWPEWTDADRWVPTPDAPSDVDRSAALASPGSTEPTPRSQAWWSGYGLGYEHENASPPGDMAEGIALSWWHGFNTAWLRRESDDREIDLAERRDREPGEIRETDLYPAGATS